MKKIFTILITLLIVGCSIENEEKDVYVPEDGIDGVDGQDGQDGEDGTNGADGTDGTNGEDGEDGIDGENCYDSIGDWNNDGVIDTYDCLDFNNTNEFVANSDHCNNRRQYAVWIDGTYYSNVNMQFKRSGDKAILCGDIAKHGTEDFYSVWVEFHKGIELPVKEPDCRTEYNSSEWIQYTSFNGTIIKYDGSVIYEIERRGEPFQYGIDAQVTEYKDGVLGASGWFVITNHNNCKGDFNFLIKDI